MNTDIFAQRRKFTITKKDYISFNGSAYVLGSQTYRYNWSNISPTIAQVKCKKWIKEGILVEFFPSNGSPRLKYYKFDIEKLSKSELR